VGWLRHKTLVVSAVAVLLALVTMLFSPRYEAEHRPDMSEQAGPSFAVDVARLSGIGKYRAMGSPDSASGGVPGAYPLPHETSAVATVPTPSPVGLRPETASGYPSPEVLPLPAEVPTANPTLIIPPRNESYPEPEAATAAVEQAAMLTDRAMQEMATLSPTTTEMATITEFPPTATVEVVEPTATEEPTEPTATEEPTEPTATAGVEEPTATEEPTEPTATEEPTEPTATVGGEEPTATEETDTPTETAVDLPPGTCADSAPEYDLTEPEAWMVSDTVVKGTQAQLCVLALVEGRTLEGATIEATLLYDIYHEGTEEFEERTFELASATTDGSGMALLLFDVPAEVESSDVDVRMTYEGTTYTSDDYGGLYTDFSVEVPAAEPLTGPCGENQIDELSEPGAWTLQEEIAVGQPVEVCVWVLEGGQPVQGADVGGEATYYAYDPDADDYVPVDTVAATKPVTSGADGVAILTFDVPSEEYDANVEITVTYGGKTYTSSDYNDLLVQFSAY
jgi:hypothetical protein